MTRILLTLGGLLVALPIALVVVWSVLGDAANLVNAGGWWMLLVYLVVPACIGLYALFGDQPYRPDR
jgi:hypothetical protein